MASTELQGHLDGMLLAILKSGPLHGYAIVEEISRRSEGEFDLAEGTIYPALHRLEEAGLLSSSWEVVSGRRRRVYALSHSGVEAVRERAASWSTFRSAVDAVFAPAISQGQL
jgi:DNA-binding PadR family transcriptional regulator